MTEAIILSVLFPVMALALIVGGGVAFYIFKFRYKTVTSDRALIITGPNLNKSKDKSGIFEDANGRSMRIIRGGGVRLRMFQTSTPVPLNSFQMELETPKTLTKGGVPVVAYAIASVKVSDVLEGIATYAEQFLGKKPAEIQKEVSNVLGTNLRAILSKLTVEEINENFEEFNSKVQEIAQKELNNMGFTITSFGLDRLRDADENNGYLENLGRARIAEVRKEAEIAESNADKETRMHKARNDQEAQFEENARQIEIAESQKERDLKAAKIKEETERARAKAEQSYLLEKAKLAQEIKEEEMKVIMIETSRNAELELEVQKRRKALADTESYEVKKRAEAEAEKERIAGETQAEVTLAQGKAEAESKRLMAEALEKYGEAAVLEMLIKVLPEYAREIAAPLSNIQEMKIIDMGGSEGKGGANRITQNVTNTMVGLQESLKATTGLDIVELIHNFTNKPKNTITIQNDKPKED